MEIKKRENIYKGYYQLDRLILKSKLTNREVDREQFITPDSVGVLIFNTLKNEVVLVKQFRVGPEKELLEIVAGKVEGKDQDLIRTVHREVLEETGYKIDQLTHLFEFYTTPGPVTEIMNLYYAEVSEQVESGGGLATENEEIEIIHLALEQFLNYPFKDAKTIMAQLWMKLK
ncbi:MAG: NUDIX hydrolase [Bacteroidetes bacterium]|nr:MAG: NUDIX hydrolase [Bacteroidota bacterium]MBL1145409.1 NUDIX hydrolase [Bacteroidota bacterium]MCB0803883.1 NUDIX hydrolase [Flavobacteriales bacterium]NOG58207.1 NUDIX hydrolase [Bacteroidota bacterium]